MKRFLGKSLGSKGAKETTSGRTPQSRINLDRLNLLIEFFPIRKKLRFYPVSEMELVFDTIVVAYCVNGNFIYSGEAIDRDSEGHPMAFHTGGNGERTPVQGVKLFQLLVPDTSELEMKLDCKRRALHGRGRRFNKGNCITLKANAGDKGVSTVETKVSKQIVLQDGPYAHTNMILLTPELHTLAVTDQRKNSRTKIHAPVTVSLLDEKFCVNCTFVDISEGTVRIRVRDSGVTMPAMLRGDAVILEIDLGEEKRHYAIKGEVIRHSPETCVTQLKGQFKDGRLGSFSPLDLLELKAGLLNYG